jgi:hypothetical protein
MATTPPTPEPHYVATPAATNTNLASPQGPASPSAQPAGVINLRTEMVLALLGSMTAALGSFVGAVTVNTTNLKALYTAVIGGFVAGASFFINSVRVWYQQKYGITQVPGD